MLQVKPIAMRDALLRRIEGQMAEDHTIFFVTADFGSPVLDDIRSKYPDRFVNVGVAEQNLINVSAGLALEGYKVFAYAIAPFITMRCFEQISVNLCLLSQVRPINVNLIGVGAGYSYVVSGPTHQCYEDISIMRTLPVIRILSPSDHLTSAALFDACDESGIRYIRLDAQILPCIAEFDDHDFNAGFRVLSKSSDEICFISTGYMTHTTKKIIDHYATIGKKIIHIDLFDITNFNRDNLLAIIKESKLIVTLEEGFGGRGGIDSIFQEIVRYDLPEAKFLSIAVSPKYSFEIGNREELHNLVGIGFEASIKKIDPVLKSIGM